MKLYLAGSLFNEAEVAQRIKEGQILHKEFPELDIFNPIEQPFNEDKSSLPTPESIYEADAREVRECDIFVFDCTNEDPGVMVELGIAIESNTKLIIGINSDIRLGSASKYSVPTYGMNHFLYGAILTHGHFVQSFDAAVDIIKNELNK